MGEGSGGKESVEERRRWRVVYDVKIYESICQNSELVI